MVRFLGSIGKFLHLPGAHRSAAPRTFDLSLHTPRVVFTIDNGQQAIIRFGRYSYRIESTLNHIIVEKETSAEECIRPEFNYCSTKKQEDFRVDDLQISRRGKTLTVDIAGEKLGLPRSVRPMPIASLPARAQIAPENLDPASVEGATILGAPLSLDGNPIDAIHYQELRNVERLQHGDVLAGHRSKLGDLSTYDRELLIINTSESSALYPVLVAARSIGQKMASKSPLQKAQAIAQLVDNEFSSEVADGNGGEPMTVGYFVERGGYCRHRAVALQVALQEAGVRSRHARGRYEGGYHAWVEVDVNGDGSFAYVIDPMQKNSDYIKDLKAATGNGCEYKVGKKTYLRLDAGATVWRPL